MRIRIAGIERESVVDGPGVRVVIFGQGCPHRCKGCHNKQTWDPDGGTLWDSDDLLREILKSKIARGITFSGGEPFLQAPAFAYIGNAVKKHGLDVVTYTGYTFEELVKIAEVKEGYWDLLCCSDYLIDGPFILSERDLSLPFRGSRNQRIIYVPKTLESGRVVEMNEWEELII